MRRASLVVVAAILVVVSGCSPAVDPRVLRIATTSSVDQSGLLATLLPAFKVESGIDVQVHVAGSGQALQMLTRGNAALAISHAPDAEAKALREHADWMYHKLAFNEFVVVGPRQDPAGVRGSSDAVEAFRRIARSGQRLVSRGDQSGTHEREEKLWTLAGQRPVGELLIVSGRGMAQALRHADEAEAYTLADEATFHRLERQLELSVHHRRDSYLVNTYAVLHAPDDADATQFARWLTVGSGRSLIRDFTVDGQRQYSVWPEGCAAAAPNDTPCERK
jgi:tungstate transport system substrate-binding protein